MAALFTARQGEYLAFIERFTARHGYSPSFDDIGRHFGTTPPSVNGMIKTLERRGLLSRLPGVARSLRVTVPASELPEGTYGAARSRPAVARAVASRGPSAVDAAIAAAVAVLDTLMPALVESRGDGAVQDAARAVARALAEVGVPEASAADVFARLRAEEARWQKDGRGTIVRPRWTRRSRR